MAIAVQGAALPGGGVVGHPWQRQQRRTLGLLEARQRRLVSRTVVAQSSVGHQPLSQLTIGFADCRAFGQQRDESLLEVPDAPALDFAFVLGLARQARVDQEAVVFGTFAIGLLHFGLLVARVRLDDRRLEVVQHHAFGHAAQELKGVLMAHQPGG